VATLDAPAGVAKLTGMSRRAFLAAMAATAAVVCLPTFAWAQTADQLRASGQAGERWDGFMEARDASVAGAVSTINAERRQVYERRAAQENVPASEVGKVYAKQIFEKAAPGTWFKTAQGDWVQK